MYHVICCMKSKDSHMRILSQYERNNVEWEDFIFDLDDVKSKFTVSEYDYAIVDVRLWWKDEAIEFFTKQNIKTILFQGDFEEILNQLYQFCSVEADPDTDASKTVNMVPDSSTEFVPEIRERFVERPVRVEIPVYKSVYTGLSNQLILVANLSKRAGATFLTLNLAKLLSNLKILTCVIEPPIDKPYIFDTVGIDEKIKQHSSNDNAEFISYPHLINDNRKIVKDKEYIDDGIIWLVGDSRKPVITDWDYFKMMKLIYASKRASTFLIDCGSHLDHESIKPIINEADMIIIVVDPLPTECMQNEPFLEELFTLKKSGLPIEFVINRHSSGIKKDELIDYLKVSPLAVVPAIEMKYIHEAIYNYKLPIEIKSVEEALSKPFYQIIKRLIPPELLKSYFNVSDTKEVKKRIFDIKNIFGRKEKE